MCRETCNGKIQRSCASWTTYCSISRIAHAVHKRSVAMQLLKRLGNPKLYLLGWIESST